MSCTVYVHVDEKNHASAQCKWDIKMPHGHSTEEVMLDIHGYSWLHNHSNRTTAQCTKRKKKDNDDNNCDIN